MFVQKCAFAYQFTTLASFPSIGQLSAPMGALAFDGTYLYGATTGAFPSVSAVFRVGIDGSGLTSIYNLRYPSGGYDAYGGVTLVGTKLFGVTFRGGTPTGAQIGDGTVFSLNLDGSNHQILKTFGNPDNNSIRPHETVVSDGTMLYGTTASGPYGSVFRMNLDGSGYQALHGFNNTDGSYSVTRLSLVGGKIYGATAGFGFESPNNGTVFTLNPDGSSFQTLHTFTGSQGVHPEGDLAIVGSTIYGVTTEGGSSGAGTVFRVNLDGTGFQTIHTFFAGTDGKFPQSGLIFFGGKLWGATTFGGDFNYGTVFGINLDGSGYEIAHSFNGANGVYPTTRMLAIGGSLYGTTERGGLNDGGTVFAIQVPEPACVAIVAFAVALAACQRRRQFCRAKAQAVD